MNSEAWRKTTKFKQTEIGKIPEDWEVSRLDKITINITDGKHGDCKNQDNSGYYFISCKDVYNKKIHYENARQITKEDFEETHKRTRLEPGDILLTNSGTIGRLAIARDDPLTSRTTFQKSVAILKPNPQKIDSGYFYYALLSKVRLLIETSGGTTQKNLLLKDIRNFMIPLCKIIEQRAIARILYSLDDKIELNQCMNKTLEGIAQAIFKHWFIDFEFPRTLLEKGFTEKGDNRGYKSSGGEMVYNEELGKEIPKGWGVKTLKDISYNFDSKRIPLSSRERQKRQGIYPYYGATGIMDFIDDYIFDGIYILMAEDGSVIDERGYPILQYAWGKFWVNNHAHILQGKRISNEFLYLLLKNKNVQHIVTGAVQPKINQANMNSLKFAIPPECLLKSFDRTIQPLFKIYRYNKEGVNTLAQIRDALLPKLMSGEIRVKVDGHDVEENV